MSTFGGMLQEYDGISIDNFTQYNLASRAFFLSHCHKDHMNGLNAKPFLDRLQSRSDIKLYMSEVTCVLLMNDPEYDHLKPFIVTILVDCPTTLRVPSDGRAPAYNVVLTLISAEHCPGSVMFYIEGTRGNVLYTGDFRLNDSEAQLEHLYDEMGHPKPLRSAYVDTTFCFPGANYIPNRLDSSQALVNLVEPFVTEGRCPILLETSTQFGYEHLFQVLWKTFGMKVHVADGKLNRYRGLPNIQEALTTNPKSTRFHASARWYDCGCSLEDCVVIRPSAMWFVNHVSVTNLVERTGPRTYRLCYSMHSSLTEVRELLERLQPNRVYPNVKLEGCDVVRLIAPSNANGANGTGDASDFTSGESSSKPELVWSYWSSDSSEGDSD